MSTFTSIHYHLSDKETPQIDASVITQLEFGRRPQNLREYSKLMVVIILHSTIDVTKAYAR